MKQWLTTLSFGMMLMVGMMGCAGIKTSILFTKQNTIYDPTNKVYGTLTGKFDKVQEFRSLLESLEYRITEKAK